MEKGDLKKYQNLWRYKVPIDTFEFNGNYLQIYIITNHPTKAMISTDFGNSDAEETIITVNFFNESKDCYEHCLSFRVPTISKRDYIKLFKSLLSILDEE